MVTLNPGGKAKREICHRWRQRENSQTFNHLLTATYRLSRQIGIPRTLNDRMGLEPLINTYQPKSQEQLWEQRRTSRDLPTHPQLSTCKVWAWSRGLSKTPLGHSERTDYPTNDKEKSNKAIIYWKIATNIMKARGETKEISATQKPGSRTVKQKEMIHHVSKAGGLEVTRISLLLRFQAPWKGKYWSWPQNMRSQWWTESKLL